MRSARPLAPGLLAALALGGVTACDPGVFVDKPVTAGNAAREAGSGGRDATESPNAGRGGADAGGGQAGATAGGSGRSNDSGDGGAHAGGGRAGHEGGSGGGAGVGGTGAGDSGSAGGTSGTAGAPPVASAGAGGAPPDPCRAPDPARVRATGTNLGAIAPPYGVAWRAGGPIVRVGDRVVWMFTESDLGGPSAAWGDVNGVTSKPPRLDDSEPLGSMLEVVPILPQPTGVGPQWYRPSAALQSGDEIVFFYSTFEGIYATGVGLGRLPTEQRAGSVITPVGQLFIATDAMGGRQPWTPVYMSGVFRESGFVYGYICHPKPDVPDEQADSPLQQPCRVTRVPERHIADGTQYRFWNGAEWMPSFAEAAVVVHHIPSGLSASFNAYLGKYVIVHSGGGNDIVLQWADAPTGPFKQFASVPTLQATGGFGLSYAALEHIGLRQDCERVLYVSYVLPLKVDEQSERRETHMTRIELR